MRRGRKSKILWQPKDERSAGPMLDVEVKDNDQGDDRSVSRDHRPFPRNEEVNGETRKRECKYVDVKTEDVGGA